MAIDLFSRKKKIEMISEENTTNEENLANAVEKEQSLSDKSTFSDADSLDQSADNTAEQIVEEVDQIALLNDKYLRLYSEFDNYRKRTNKEKLDLISTASSAVLKDMLGILDDFERAIANNENVDDPNSLKEGFQLIHNKFKVVLEAKGLKQMPAKGELFNPDIHEAIANIPSPTEDMKGKVIDDVEKGYYLNEKVIRFAKVVVGN